MSAVDEECIGSRCSLESKPQTQGAPDSQNADCGTVPGLCLVINNETVRIRSISVKITGLELKQAAAKQTAVEVSLTTAEGESLSVDQLPSGKKKKKESMLSRIMKAKKSAKQDSPDKKQAVDLEAATVTPDSSAGGSAGVADNVSQNSTPTPQQKLSHDQQQASSGMTALDGNEDNGRCSSGSSEISIPPHDEAKVKEAVRIAAVAAAAAAAASSASNTVESETRGGEVSGSDAPPTIVKPKPKKLPSFLNPKKSKSKGSTDQLLCTSNFPHDVPENVKTLFQITLNIRLCATVYTSNKGCTPDVKKQKALMMESDRVKRFTVDGKSRSVWLDPPPGEKVEIWKEYFGDDTECNRALGRLPGTDKYGYVLPDEIDPDGECLTREEKEEYKDMLAKLAMFQSVYDEQYM